MLKEPKAGEWWIDRDEDDYIVLVVGFDHSGDPVIEDKWGDLDAYEMATFLKNFNYEPDCNGFDWVKPEPVPVESPDDWVTQDVVVPRNNIDEWAWVTEGQIPRESQWERGNGNFKYKKHGDKSCNEILHVRCLRKHLPKPAEPDYVTQDRVVCRAGIDEYHYGSGKWKLASGEWDIKHGTNNLHIRCLRSQQPEPAKTRVELRLWVHRFTGEIVHDGSSVEDTDWHEVLFDTTGQPYYLKD